VDRYVSRTACVYVCRLTAAAAAACRVDADVDVDVDPFVESSLAQPYASWTHEGGGVASGARVRMSCHATSRHVTFRLARLVEETSQIDEDGGFTSCNVTSREKAGKGSESDGKLIAEGA
jgi:hypothetical protein